MQEIERYLWQQQQMDQREGGGTAASPASAVMEVVEGGSGNKEKAAPVIWAGVENAIVSFFQVSEVDLLTFL